MVDIRHLTAGYEHPVIKDISMHVKKGEIVGILGPNGSGKTTIALSILGFTKIYKGTITVEKYDITRHKKDIRQRISLLMQVPDNQLFARTVYEEIAISPYKAGKTPEEVKHIVNTILETIQLQHKADNPPHKLSFGEKKKLAMGTILASSPQYLILDEPFAGLDFSGRVLMENIIKGQKADNKGIILISHDLLSLTLADRIYIMGNGTIVKHISQEEIPTIIPSLPSWNLYVPHLEKLFGKGQRSTTDG